MDGSNVLDSILNSMRAPPQMSEEQRRRMKAQNEMLQQNTAMNRQTLMNFRKKVEKMVSEFVQKGNSPYLEFEAMDRIFRNIIHEVTEVAGLIACSFGKEEVDRYTVVYHKDCGPSEHERRIRSSGGTWNKEIAAEVEAKCAENVFKKPDASELNEDLNVKRRKKFVPEGVHYGQKYQNVDIAPQKTSTKSAYGEVPSHLKRDHRSIEQTMADIRAKRQKTAESSSQETFTRDTQDVHESQDTQNN